jgi:transcriptional regulator with GAF, ATPase, and Fis domain/Tfp pilus assembly protein PilF
MSNARDENKDGFNYNPGKRPDSESIFSPSEEIGLMHFSTENYSTALEYFKKAASSSDVKEYPDRFRLSLRISDCHRKKGDYREARRYLEKARAALQEMPAAEDLGKIEYREAFILLDQGYYDEALKIGFSAYRRLKHSDEHSEVADIQILLANCYHRLGLAGEAEEFFMDALSSYRRIEDKVGTAYVYNNLGLLHKNACRWQRAIASLSKSLEIANDLGLTQHLIRVHLNLGIVYGKLRRFSEALSSFATASNMAERFGDNFKLTKAILMEGRTYVQCGEVKKAEKFIVRGQVMANDAGYGRESALADEYLGELMIARGRYHEALVNLNNGLRKARKIAPEGDVTAEILRRLADVHYQLSNYQKALAYIEEGLEVASNCGEYYEMGFFLRTRSLCLARTGSLDEAIEAMRTSVEMFDRYSNVYEKARSEQLLARAYIKKRDDESLLKAKQILNDSIMDFGKADHPRGQILSQVILAAVEARLDDLDGALLAVYEADRLAEGEDGKIKRMLRAMRARVEARMAKSTARVLDQFAALGGLQASTHSREKLSSELDSTLGFLAEKAGARGGFIAIRSAEGEGFEIITSMALGKRKAKALHRWLSGKYSSREASEAAIFSSAEEPDLAGLIADNGNKPLLGLYKKLGFEGEELGCLFLYKDQDDSSAQIHREAVHFIGAYTSLISLSVFELLRNERKQARARKPAPESFSSIITDNGEMLKLLNLAERVAHSNATVLLQGETGTGKGLIAYAIHLLSDRREQKFIHVNCAALPEPLLESELFGHVRGAFTGAVANKDGLLRQAHGGTIFLDEIGKTTLAMQGKLLQFLDTGKVRRVGSNEMIPVDVKVICASKIDLLKLCEEGRFLEDFYYRINDFPLEVPPLRKRKDDIPLLLEYYLEKVATEMGKIITGISPEAMDKLVSYRWPGNVRELEKVVKRAVILADDGDEIGLEHLPPVVLDYSASASDERTSKLTLKEKICELEKREILDALKRNAWNRSRAATELGISYPNLLSKIKTYRLQ